MQGVHLRLELRTPLLRHRRLRPLGPHDVHLLARVITARDGADARERFTAHPEIDVVLLELTMPGSSGDEVFEEMRKVRSDARILLTSGYDARDAVSRLQARGLAGSLRKPWDGRSLVDVVARTASDEPVSALETSVEG